MIASREEEENLGGLSKIDEGAEREREKAMARQRGREDLKTLLIGVLEELRSE